MFYNDLFFPRHWKCDVRRCDAQCRCGKLCEIECESCFKRTVWSVCVLAFFWVCESVTTLFFQFTHWTWVWISSASDIEMLKRLSDSLNIHCVIKCYQAGHTPMPWFFPIGKLQVKVAYIFSLHEPPCGYAWWLLGLNTISNKVTYSFPALKKPEFGLVLCRFYF